MAPETLPLPAPPVADLTAVLLERAVLHIVTAIDATRNSWLACEVGTYPGSRLAQARRLLCGVDYPDVEQSVSLLVALCGELRALLDAVDARLAALRPTQEGRWQ